MRRILLIDDDPLSRELFSILLAAGGFSIETAPDGESGVDAISMAQFEAVLVDAQMPGLSGKALIAALRSHPATKIVLMSGNSVSEEIKQAADGFLYKPFDAATLAKLLDTMSSSATCVATTGGEITESVQFTGDMIDLVILAKLRGVMPEANIRRLYIAAHEDLRMQIGHLDTAMREQNIDEVRRIAHRIKGGCAMAGIRPIAEIASHLESGEKLVWPGALQQLRLLEAELQRIIPLI